MHNDVAKSLFLDALDNDVGGATLSNDIIVVKNFFPSEQYKL